MDFLVVEDRYETQSTISELSLAETAETALDADIDENEFSDASAVSLDVSGHGAERKSERGISDSELLESKIDGEITLQFEWGDGLRGEKDALDSALIWSKELEGRFSDCIVAREPEPKIGLSRYEVVLLNGKKKYSTRAVKKFLSIRFFKESSGNKVIYRLHDLYVIEGAAFGRSEIVTSFRNKPKLHSLETQVSRVLEPFENLDENEDPETAWKIAGTKVQKEDIFEVVRFIKRLTTLTKGGGKDAFRRSMQAAVKYNGLVDTSKFSTEQLSNLKDFQVAVVDKWGIRDKKRGPYNLYCGDDEIGDSGGSRNKPECLKYNLCKAVQSLVEKRTLRMVYITKALAFLANWAHAREQPIILSERKIFTTLASVCFHSSTIEQSSICTTSRSRREGWKKGGSEGERKEARKGGSEGRQVRGTEVRTDGGRVGGRAGGREGKRKAGGRERGRAGQAGGRAGARACPGPPGREGGRAGGRKGGRAGGNDEGFPAVLPDRRPAVF